MLRTVADFSHTLLYAPELHTAASRFLSIFSRAPADEYLTRQCNLVKSSVEKLEDSLQRDRSSAFTGTLAEKDNTRDRIFVGFRDFLNGLLGLGDVMPKKAEAAKVIFEIFRRNDLGLYREGYIRESAKLNVLLDELSSPENIAHLKTLNAMHLYEALRNAQQDFEGVYQEKVNEEAKKEYPLLKETASDIAYRLDALFAYIDTNALDLPDRYKSVVEELNEAIVDIMTPARARQTRKENIKDAASGTQE